MILFKIQFENTRSALCYSICRQWNNRNEEKLDLPYNDVVRFVTLQYGQMSDYLHIPIMIATLIFNLTGYYYGKKMFYHMPHEQRKIMIAAWKKSPLGLCRDLIKYYESLSALPFYSRLAHAYLNKETND